MNIKVDFNENPSCEHCGDLEPFSMTFSEVDYGCPWCRWCVEANPDSFNLSDVNWKELEKKEDELKVKHFQERLDCLSLKKIEFITCESGYWQVLKFNDEVIADGHSINEFQWLQILKDLGCEVEEREISDEDMENGEYWD